MNRAPRKFKYVFRYVFGLMSLVAIGAFAVIVSFYFAYDAERITQERITMYHAESVAYAERLLRESQSLLRLLGHDIPSISELSGQGEQAVLYGPDAGGTLQMMENTVADLNGLERRYGGEEYTATLDRIEDRFRAVEYSILRRDPSESSRRAILAFVLAVEQLRRQHTIAADKFRPDAETLLARVAPYASVIATILLATGIIAWLAVWLLRRSMARQVEMEDALAANMERMHHLERLESLGRLVGGIAHDFNNLLTAILGQAGLLRDRQPDERTQKGLAEIQEAGQQAAALTRQLLDFGRPPAVEVRVVDINEVIGNAESLLARIIGEDIDVNIDYASALYPVKLDPGQLQQVLINLVVNARDAMPDGGRLTIATTNVHISRSAAELAAVAAGQYAKITVTDTGIGMSEDIRDRVFEPYFTTKEMGQGTGLGLATAYGIVKAANGHISVSSRPGAGSRFDILLPRSAGTALTPGEKPVTAEDLTGNETVLIVEDERQIREFLREGLESLGYQTLLAADAAGGLEYCAAGNGRIDVILSDVILPGMNGAEMLTHALKLQPQAKAILMSGYTDDVLERTGLNTPATPLIPKPFEIADIARMIRSRLAEDDDRQAAALAS